MSTHGGYSFPGLNTLFGRVHRVSRSLVPSFLRSFGSSLRSDGSGPSSLRSCHSSPTHRFITKSTPQKRRCTRPTQKFCIRDPIQLIYLTDSLWGFALGVTQILGWVLGVMQILAFSDINMLVLPTQIFALGG